MTSRSVSGPIPDPEDGAGVVVPARAHASVLVWSRAWLVRHTLPRRVLTIPLLLVITVVSLVVVPVVCAVAAPLALRRGGRGRAIRAGIFLLVYLGTEIVGLCWAMALWLAKGVGGRKLSPGYRAANYVLVGRVLGWLYSSGTTLFNVVIRLPEDYAEPATGPILVLSRHGGPGDSFLVIHDLLVRRLRNPRVVLKDTLRFDPLIDVVVGRVPHRFIRPNPGDGDDVASGIGELAVGLGPRDALVIFPEGGNFTTRRRIRAIERLRRRGHHESATRAERLRHTLPPHPAGVFAAIDAAPTADVVFVAHTGLDHMETVAEVWQNVPLTEAAEATWWAVSGRDVPAGEEARLRWLQDNWAMVDGWIHQRRRERG